MSLTSTRRKTERKTCLLQARAYADGQAAVRCELRDLTPDGAKLVAAEPLTARKLLLLLPAIGEVWAAEVRWRRGGLLGVRFVPGEADLVGLENPSDSDVFAMRLQVAQVAKSAQSLPKKRVGN